MLKKTLLVVALSVLALESLEGQTFTRITSGDIVNNGGFSWGAAWGDYDNDGLIDLFVANNGAENNFLYRNNGDGTFVRITVGDIVNDGTWSSAGSWGDYDNDGYLDLFVSNKDENSLLFSNNGDGTFTKITTGIIVNDAGNSNGASWGDYDNDGYLDLFVANGGELNEDNFLYSNNRDGTFTKITSGDIVNDGGRSSGSSWGDYDNDGDLDLFVTNGASWESQDNFLYQNNGDGNFIRISSGDIVIDGGNSQSSNWGDYDNDGDLDLFVTNSADSPQDNFLYSNNGDGTFIKISTGFIVTNDGISLGVSSADYDNDGDLDLFVASDNGIDNYLFLNEGNSNNWINIKLVGTRSNNSAIGAKVRVKASINGNPIWQMNEISGQTGGGFGGQNSLNAEFGLGDATIIDSIKVEWLSGVEIFTDVTVNQFVKILEVPGITGITPSISLSPNPLNFGDVNSGDTLSMQLSISNTGNAALDVTNIAVSNSEFSVASPISFQVAAGTTLEKTIYFHPDTTGLKSATLTITSNASNLPTATVTLSGNGITRPVYTQIGEVKITASDGASGDFFGLSVSISGDYAVVGSSGDDDNGGGSGSAYVFKRTGTSWQQEAKLLPSDGAAEETFGGSVSISGDYAIVGATGDFDNGIRSGSAYVFKRTGTIWQQEAKLLPADGAGADLFGVSVSISGDYAVVGAQGDNGFSGSAYVFKRTGTSWAQEAKLLPSDGAASDLFGHSVSISGDYAVVGSSGDDDNGDFSGSAYVFKRTGTSWAQEAKLLPSDGAAGDEFGVSVSISGDHAVVGAKSDDDNGDFSGSAYVFKRTGTSWAQEAKLLPSDGAAFDEFGNSVSISGDFAVVGANRDDDNGDGDRSGSAYLFKRSGTSWAQEAKLLAFDGAADDYFGSSVSISGDYAVVGAFEDDDNGIRSGSAYIYSGSSGQPSISLSPDQLNFGDVNSGDTLSMQLSISNTGNAALDVTNIAVSNSEFSVASPISFQVAAGTILEKTIYFHPDTTGLKIATLTITSNASHLPTATVTLSGKEITPAYAQTNEFKILPLDGEAVDRFGYSVSISGDYAVVAAIGDDDNGSSSGSAYVFKRTGTSWGQETKLLASDGAAGDYFGWSVSIFGDYAVVGASYDDDNGNNSGSAYVFKRTGTIWAKEAKLLPFDGAAFEEFGVSVSISGDYAVVGAIGSAYVYKRSGTSWAQEAKLLASDGAAGAAFGHSVSISGDYAVVGASYDDDNGSSSGSAYVFKRTGTSWAQEAKLLPVDGAADDGFGGSVSISGDYAVVGASADDDNGSFSGSAYVFKRTGTSWAQEAKLLSSDGTAGDYFGGSVSISGDYAVVGAWRDDNGSAYVYKRSGTSWTQEVKLLASDGARGDDFGFSVSISGEHAVVGARRDNDNGIYSGSAYVFSGIKKATFYPGDTDNNGIVDAMDVLPIGVYFLSEVTARDTVTVSWSSVEVLALEVGSAVYADANGDGIVDERDVIAIGVNWGNTHTNTSASVAINLSDITLLNHHRDAFQEIYNSLSGESESVKAMKAVLRSILGIQVPEVFTLYQNYPNPFNPRTTITFDLPKPEIVTLTIFNLLGQVITVPVYKERYNAGFHTVQLDASHFSSGVYLYRLEAGRSSAVRKLLVVK